jgi:uncharacterized membrane protein YgcG
VKETSVRRVPQDLLEEQVRLVIRKIEGSPEPFVGDINKWIDDSLKGITYKDLLDATVSYEYVKSVLSWKQDMISRSTPLTNEEIEEFRKTGNSPRTVDVIRANGTDQEGNKVLVYLTNFRFQVNYVNGMQKITLVGGRIITPPGLFETMAKLTGELSVDDVPNEYNIRKDNFLGTAATSIEADPNWNPPSSLSSKILDALNFFAKGTGNILNKVVTQGSDPNIVKSDIQSLLGIPGSLLYDYKWGVYGGFAILYFAETLLRKQGGLIGNALGLSVRKLRDLYEHLHHILHGYEQGMSVFKEVKAFTSPGLTTGIFGEGSLAASASDTLIVLLINRALSQFIGGIKAGWVGIGIEVIKFTISAVKLYVSEKERIAAEQDYIRRGLVADGANYGIEIPLSQFGMISQPALHNIFKKYEEYTDEAGRVVRGDLARIRYTLDGKPYFDYPWNYEYYNSGPDLTMIYPDGERGILPEGYTGPVTFYPFTEVGVINSGITKQIKATNTLPNGARQEIPIPEINPNDIPDLFEPGWHTGNFDWLAAAEEAIRGRNLTPSENGQMQSAINDVKNFNKFMEEVSRVVQEPNGNLTVNFGFLDQMEYTNRYMVKQIEQFDDFVSNVLSEGINTGLISTGNLSDGTPAVVVNREEISVQIKDENRTNVSKAAKRKTQRQNPSAKKKTPITPTNVKKFLPRPPKNTNGRVLTQQERNERRSRSLGFSDDRDVESVINTEVPVRNAPKLNKSTGTGTRNTGGRRSGTGGGGGTTSGGGGGGVIEATCFPHYVKVKTLDGYVNISDIMIGDSVISFDINNKEIPSVVTHKFVHDGDERSDVYRYEFTNGSSLDITKNHSVLTKNGEFKQIGTISSDDFLMYEGEWVNMTSVKYLGCFEVYNIEVKDNHTYIADGFYVHNALKKDPRLNSDTGGGPTVTGGPDSDVSGGGGVPGGTTGGGTTGGGTTGGGTGGGTTGGGTTGGGTPKGSPGNEACFPSYAVVSTPLGEKKISDAKNGDKLFVYDKETGQFMVDSVEDIIQHNDNATVFEFILSDGTSIHSTKNHYVLIENNLMKQIGLLSPDDMVIKKDGGIVYVIDSIELGGMVTYSIKTRSGLPYVVNDLIVQSS